MNPRRAAIFSRPLFGRSLLVMDSLETALNTRLHQFFMGTTCIMTRALLEEKARSVSAGMSFLHERGEEAFQAFLNAFFYEEIPNSCKPVQERPPLKRPMVDEEALNDDPKDDYETRARKRQRLDPSSVTDAEETKGWLTCTGGFRACRARFDRQTPFYVHPTNPYGMVCGTCWTQLYKTSHCLDCGAERSEARPVYCTNAGPQWKEIYLCGECSRLRKEPRVVRLLRTEKGARKDRHPRRLANMAAPPNEEANRFASSK